MISTVRDYTQVLQDIRAVVEGEPDLVANLSNIAAILKTLNGYFWVGFYLVKGDGLVLGPFQGPVACTRIAKGRGVCGTSWAENRSILVPDVHLFPGHIACSALSQSEVVVPIRNEDGAVTMILDVDSDQLNDFSQADVNALEEVSRIVSSLQSESL
jgi:GAF domain-containing protein